MFLKYRMEPPNELKPSKSANKRRAAELQDLGVELAELPARVLDSLPLSDALRTALADLKEMSARGALLRQRQYIGKLMRRVDPAPIRAALAARKLRHDSDVRALQRVEKWRDALLQDDAALARLSESYPQIDEPRIRAILARAAQEREQASAPRAARELYAALRELIAPI